MNPTPIGDSYPCLTVAMPSHLYKKLIDPRSMNHLARFDYIMEDDEMMKVLNVSFKYSQMNG